MTCRLDLQEIRKIGAAWGFSCGIGMGYCDLISRFCLNLMKIFELKDKSDVFLSFFFTTI